MPVFDTSSGITTHLCTGDAYRVLRWTEREGMRNTHNTLLAVMDKGDWVGRVKPMEERTGWTKPI